MKMKKALALALAAAMILGLTACGGGQQNSSASKSTPPAGTSSSSSGSASASEEKPLSGTVVIYSTQTDVDHGDSFGDDKAWDYCASLIENSDGISTNSSSAVYKSVYNGEYAVGLTYDNGAISLLMNGAEGVEIVWPEKGNTVCAFASAMIKDCPHPELAAAVLDTLSSAEFQLAREKAAGSRGPNTTYTNADSYFPADIDSGVVPLDFAAIAGQKSTLIEKWNDMWAAANS